MRLFSTRNGMAPQRHSAIGNRETSTRIDTDLIERTRVAKDRLHTAGLLPAWQRYKEPAHADSN